MRRFIIQSLVVTAVVATSFASTPVNADLAANSRTQYTSFGLPMYPTPKQNIMVLPSESNGDGGKSETVQMDPHAPLDAVVAWYKARMPAGSFQPSPNPEHAGFQVSKAGNKTLLIVVLDHKKGHVQTDILLIKRTSK